MSRTDPRTLEDPLSQHGGGRPLLNRAGPSGATSGLAASSSHHLRQRSIGSPRNQDFGGQLSDENPFDDALAGPPLVPMPNMQQPTPHRAALMVQTDEAALLPAGDATTAREQAMLMRGNKAEWTPTQQTLYSSSALQGDAVFNASRGSPASSTSAPSSPWRPSPAMSTSSSRFEVTPDDFLFHSTTYPEPDDDLHDPGPMKLKSFGPDHRLVEPRSYKSGQWLSWHGFLNLAAVVVLCLALVFVFAGLPIWQWITKLEAKTYGAAGLGGVNGTGQVPDIPNYRGLIDKDTPDSALTKMGFMGKELQLVFSDEFNEDGRQFYEGMDPYWTAVDLHYWQTNNIEWYDPDNVYTEGGALVIELTKETDENSHGFGYLGGMLQTWNQFCFVGGYIEVAVSLPGSTTVSGLWPAAWTMSNLGRAGYGGSLDGTWPYVGSKNDLGTLPNQTDPTTGEPNLPPSMGDKYADGDLSHLKGQRFSRCTCSSETDHPGPQYANGTWKGRGASEIDIFEATVIAAQGIGEISQSAQWAPFNPGYEILNDTTEVVEFYDTKFNTIHNTYLGGNTQQVTSGLSETDPDTYNSTTNFMKYGFEYITSERDGWGNGRITWTQDDEPMWTITDRSMAANNVSMVGNRVVTAEPMYILLNLGMSENFGVIQEDKLVFPSKMRVDYVRVYQDKDHISVGCDPKENPTVDYINRNKELYMNPNITVYGDVGRVFPKNSLVDTC
ncbi:hypothetical protein JCM10213_003734 [Rhodosporidiobolus nylandii]